MSPRRTHIAMIGIPIVSHVLPGLGIVRELVARGHRVTYANDPVMADRIEATGAELVSCTSVLPVADNNWPTEPVAAMDLFLDEAMQALPQLHAAYDHDPADLYLYDIGAYAARALAESQGRPLMQLSPSFVAWEGYEEEVAAHLRGLPGAPAHREFGRWLMRLRGDHPRRGRLLRSARAGPRADPRGHAAQRRQGRHRDGDLRRALLRRPRRHRPVDPARGRGEGPADLPRLGVHAPAGVLPPVPRGVREPARLARRAPDRPAHRPARARRHPAQRRSALLGPAAGDPGAGGRLRHPRGHGRLR